MLNRKSLTTPINVNEKLQLEDGSGKTNGIRFRYVVGGLLYLTHTRPDLVFAIGLLSRYLHNLSRHHMAAVKRILHYVAGTIDFRLQYHHVGIQTHWPCG